MKKFIHLFLSGLLIIWVCIVTIYFMYSDRINFVDLYAFGGILTAAWLFASFIGSLYFED